MKMRKEGEANGRDKLRGDPQVEIRLKVNEGHSLYVKDHMDSPQKVVMAMADMMSDLDREYVMVLNMNTHNQAICWNIVSMGSINSAEVSISNIFKSAILSNAAGILAFHNHPSGNLEASEEDIAITKRLIEAGNVLGISVLDHIIVAGYTGEYYSLRENEPGDLVFHEKTESYGVHETDPQEWRKRRQEKMKALTDRLEQGIRNVFESDQYKQYLNVLSKFTRYSARNIVLIASQNPNASYVAGYQAWKTKFGRQVKKGAKAIQIIAPMKYNQTVEQEKVDPSTKQVILGSDGKPIKEKVQRARTGFKIENVFDISDTYGDPLPTIYQDIEGDVNRFDQFVQAICQVSPVPIEMQPLEGKDGYYSLVDKKIVIRDDMSEKQTTSALIHEMSHAVLHDLDMNHLEESLKARNKDSRLMECEAESISYAVCRHFGIEVESSFTYLASWAKNQELPELHASLQTIRNTASKFIDDLEHALTKIRREELARDPFFSSKEDMYAIYQLDTNNPDIPYRFEGSGSMEANDWKPRTGDYRQIYTSPLEDGMTLDNIYEKTESEPSGRFLWAFSFYQRCDRHTKRWSGECLLC